MLIVRGGGGAELGLRLAGLGTRTRHALQEERMDIEVRQASGAWVKAEVRSIKPDGIVVAFENE